MPDENDLRRLLADTDAPHRLDANAIVARSRRRRLPRQLAAGAVGVLAIAGVFVLGVTITAPQNESSTTAEDSAVSDSAPATESMKTFGADSLNTCGAPLTEVEPSRYGLEAAVKFPEVASAEAAITGSVTITNTTSETVEGLTAFAPVVTVSRNDVVVGTASGTVPPGDGILILEPGDSVEYPILALIGCDSPALPPGTYELSAAVDFSPAANEPNDGALFDLVTGPRSTISLE